MDGLGFSGSPGAYQIPPIYQHGGRELYVCNRAGVAPGNGRTPKNPFSTLVRALSYVNSNPLNDGAIIHVLAGHIEAITGADFWTAANIPSHVTIVGHSLPRLTWTTAAAAQVLISSIHFGIIGMRLEMLDIANDLTVTAPLKITGSRFRMFGNVVTVATAAARLCTTAIEVGTGADDCDIGGNVIWGDVLGTPTDVIKVTAAVKRPMIHHNNIQVATSAVGVGPLRFTAAAIDVLVQENKIDNKLASSTAGITGIANLTGVMEYNSIGIEAASGAASAIVTPGNTKLVQNYGATPGKSGILIGTAST